MQDACLSIFKDRQFVKMKPKC